MSAIEAAEKAVEDAQQAYLTDGATLTPRQARERLTAAIEDSNDILAARRLSEEKLQALEQDLKWAKYKVEDCVKDVVSG